MLIRMDKTTVITRKTCRLCGTGTLRPVLSLGDLCVSDFVPSPAAATVQAPLELVLCKNQPCGLLQLKHTAPQELMYARHYWYKSAINPVIVNDLEGIVRQALNMAAMKPGDVFLDIGANDGTLLGFVPKEYLRVGCEPADNLQDELGCTATHVIHDFWSREAYDKLGIPKAKVVTAIGMFYDMEDPNQFIRDAAAAMTDDGIFIAQLMCLRPMIEKNDIGNICHEHLEYYSYASLVYLFERNGLEIFRVEENGINGGSYRLFGRKLRGGSIAYPEPAFDYDAFAARIEANKTKTVEFITQAVSAGRRVYGYGASTKGNTILQYYGLDASLIAAIADKNPEKFGKFTVGTNIPIMPEDEARVAKPDYFFILPFAFTDTFVLRERDWLSGGGKFIVCTPEFKIIGEI